MRWSPSPAVRSEYVIVWAVVGVGAALLLPVALRWPLWGQLALAGAGLVLAGAINAVFHRLGS